MNNERKQILVSELKQLLWALLLVYLILAGIAFLFGKQIGFKAAILVCVCVGLLVTITFSAIFIVSLLLHLFDDH